MVELRVAWAQTDGRLGFFDPLVGPAGEEGELQREIPVTEREAGIERDGLLIVTNCLVRLLRCELTEPQDALNPRVVFI